MIDRTGTWVILAGLVLPWIGPLGNAPTPVLQPWLLSVVCGVVLWLWRDELNAREVQRGWLLAAAISAFIGLTQYAGVRYNLAPWVAPALPGEAFGNLRQRNQFATLMSIGLAALIWMPLRRSSAGKTEQAAVTASTLLVMTASAASASRTGLLQLLLLFGVGGVWGLWRLSYPRGVMVVAALSYIVASLILPRLLPQEAPHLNAWARLLHGDAGCENRMVLWTNVIQLIKAKPWTGWGWGELDYAHFITLYEGPRFCAILDNAHDLPLHLAVELGVPVMFAACVMGLWLVWRARPWREPAGDRQFAWAVLGLILLHSLLEYPLWYGPFQLATLCCLWLLRTTEAPSDQTKSSQCAKWRDRAAAVGVFAAVAYAVWDYHRVSQVFLPPQLRDECCRDNPLEKIRGSWLFRDQVKFAEFSITPLTPENAARLHDMGLALLHYSPEASVVEKLIDSALLLGRDSEAAFIEARFRAAYPREYASWAAANGNIMHVPN